MDAQNRPLQTLFARLLLAEIISGYAEALRCIQSPESALSVEGNDSKGNNKLGTAATIAAEKVAKKIAADLLFILQTLPVEQDSKEK